MLRGALQRLEGMIGEWSGEVTRPGEPASRLFLSVAALYDGTVVEIESRGYAPEGHYLFGSLGYLCECADGGLRYSLYSSSFGALVMREAPDEPDTLLLQCALDTDRTFHATLALDGDVLSVASAISRDGKPPPRSQRILSQMQRLNTRQRRLLSRKAGVE
ncbi:MAG: hypothetical protein HS108_12055 [Planctomycetes bacterium]|jgi:hypothetical protein|nr:hypothetical protein [Planctomycetota bacterium]MCL4731164.1 hypothetical protein [Planctomycetota bacterium]